MKIVMVTPAKEVEQGGVEARIASEVRQGLRIDRDGRCFGVFTDHGLIAAPGGDYYLSVQEIDDDTGFHRPGIRANMEDDMQNEKMMATGGLAAGRAYPVADLGAAMAQSQAAAQQAGALQRDTVSSKLGEMADVIERLWTAAQFAGMHADSLAGPEPGEAATGAPSPASQGLVEALAFKVGDLNRIASMLEHHQSRIARALG